jgi:Spy/CpxP family protein refolding chaperone
MKKIQLILATAAVALTLALGGKALAQPQGFGGGGGGGGGGRGGGGFGGGMNFQNMDPQQMQQMIQQRINSSYRDQMDVTNDDEWALIEGRINAVTQARLAATADTGGVFGMMGMGGMRGGNGGNGGGGPGGGFRNMFGQPSPESQALQKAIDDNAPAAQIKTLIAKLQAAHKEKLDKLAKAQEDLRAVLTTRQEAIAIMGGLLN